jgi:hypothetical protein
MPWLPPDDLPLWINGLMPSRWCLYNPFVRRSHATSTNLDQPRPTSMPSGLTPARCLSLRSQPTTADRRVPRWHHTVAWHDHISNIWLSGRLGFLGDMVRMVWRVARFPVCFRYLGKPFVHLFVLLSFLKQYYQLYATLLGNTALHDRPLP